MPDEIVVKLAEQAWFVLAQTPTPEAMTMVSRTLFLQATALGRCPHKRLFAPPGMTPSTKTPPCALSGAAASLCRRCGTRRSGGNKAAGSVVARRRRRVAAAAAAAAATSLARCVSERREWLINTILKVAFLQTVDKMIWTEPRSTDRHRKEKTPGHMNGTRQIGSEERITATIVPKGLANRDHTFYA